MNPIAANLASLRQRIAVAAAAAGRHPASLRLVAVGKTQPLAAILAAADAGQRDFGENYLQEALAKIDAARARGLVWHFIGPIQSNKTRAIAEHFDWVHSVDRLKIARRLAEHRPPERAPLNICLQVNIDGEASKAGVTPNSAAALAAQIADLPGLRLRGLMALPAPADGLDAQRRPFAALRELRDAINTGDLDLDTLSMGMTDDLEAAVLEGATLLRVGTAIFGPRT